MAFIPAVGRRITAVLIGLSLATAASAAPITFDFEFNGLAFNNTAKAVGSITFEESLLPNRWSEGESFHLHFDTSEVLDLGITVSGASSGNGHYDKSDFGFVIWQTNGVLDFSQPLVGQATHDVGWGTSQNYDSGDFNVIAQAGGPSGQGQFQFASDGGLGDSMILVSFSPVIGGAASLSAVPEPGVGLLALGGLGVTGLMLSRRRRPVTQG